MPQEQSPTQILLPVLESIQYGQVAPSRTGVVLIVKSKQNGAKYRITFENPTVQFVPINQYKIQQHFSDEVTMLSIFEASMGSVEFWGHNGFLNSISARQTTVYLDGNPTETK